MNEGRWCGCFTPARASRSLPRTCTTAPEDSPAAAAAAKQKGVAGTHKHKSAGACGQDFCSQPAHTHTLEQNTTARYTLRTHTEMTETQFVTQLGVDSNLWIQGTKVEERKLDLSIVDHANQLAWNGVLSDLVAKEFYHQYGLTAEDYWKTILTQLQTPSENFLFTVREDKFYIEKVGLNQVKLTYAKLQLQKKDLKEALISTTMALLAIQNKLRSKNELLETSIADVNRDLNVLSEQFEKVTDDTIVKEELLLSNFLDLLNAKKEKILQLQSELTDKGSVEPGSGDSVYDDDTEVDEENEEPTDTASSSMGTKRSKKTDVSDNFDDVMDL